MSENVTEDSVTVQRSPRYFRFMLVGAILFAIVALVLTFAFPEQPNYDRGQIFGFLLLGGIVVGIGIGAVVALIVGSITARRARTVAAAHTTTAPVDEQATDE
ncbi:MAG: hypothetical protein QOE16_565 [Microbacteriaceae bacterium]|jgi:MFS family permease|nr:hypothetical protein [Microbacteriaceae bacterium]